MLVKPLTLAEAITAAEHELSLAAVADSRLNAELLAAHLFGLWTRAEVRERYNDKLSQQDLDRYQSFIRRRINHEPLQYITGETEFFGLRLYTSPQVLIPRADTEILVEETLKEAGRGDLRILDIGTGSGCIALALASKLPDAKIIGIDSSAEAISLAEKNKRRCGFTNVEFWQSDLYNDADLNKLGVFDLIVSNPPYIPLGEYLTLDKEVQAFEPRSALTDEGDGLSFYRRIFSVIPSLLKPGGKLLVEIGHGAADATMGLAAGLRYLRTVKDLAGVDRVILWDESNFG